MAGSCGIGARTFYQRRQLLWRGFINLAERRDDGPARFWKYSKRLYQPRLK
jgi:hypothetical protein